MTKLEDILEMHRSIGDSLSQRMTEFEKQLKSNTSESSKTSIEKLATEFKDFKSSVWNVLSLLKSLTTNLAAQIDEVDSQSRRNVLLFGGIDEAQGENLISTVLSTIHVLMGLPNVQASAIQHCQRLGVHTNNRPRPILVRFNDMSMKQLIWSNKKKLKTSAVVLSEFLTRTRQSLFVKARKHFGVRNAWTQNGIIFIKLPNGDRKKVITPDGLEDLIIQFPCSTPSVSPADKVPSVEKPKVISPRPMASTSVRPVTRKNFKKP